MSRFPADAHNNITLYELWWDEDSDWVDLCIKVGEDKALTYLIQTNKTIL